MHAYNEPWSSSPDVVGMNRGDPSARKSRSPNNQFAPRVTRGGALGWDSWYREKPSGSLPPSEDGSKTLTDWPFAAVKLTKVVHSQLQPKSGPLRDSSAELESLGAVAAFTMRWWRGRSASGPRNVQDVRSSDAIRNKNVVGPVDVPPDTSPYKHSPGFCPKRRSIPGQRAM